MKVAVVGAGAIGAYVGASLCRAGADVHLIARGAHLEALREKGVQVLSPRGDFHAHPPATDDASDVGPVDFVFLGLKANSYASAGPLLEPLMHDETAVVAGQNGIPWWYFHGLEGPHKGRRIEAVDPGGSVSRVIAPERAIGCVVYAGTELGEPGVVHHLEGTRFSIGRARRDDLRPLPRVQQGDDRRRPEVPCRGAAARRDLGQADGQRRVQPAEHPDAARRSPACAGTRRRGSSSR